MPLQKEFCSGELLGLKMTVPCDPVNYLKFQYGETWWIPAEKHYKFLNMNWSNGKPRQIDELPYLFRSYDKLGRVNVNSSLKYINPYYLPLTGKNLTVLPTDDAEFI